jgi:ankyrin repeat protein
MIQINEFGDIIEKDKPAPEQASKPKISSKFLDEDHEIYVFDARGNPCPLHTNSARGDIEGVTDLIDAGFDVNEHDNTKATPLHHAAFNGHKEIARYFFVHFILL